MYEYRSRKEVENGYMHRSSAPFRTNLARVLCTYLSLRTNVYEIQCPSRLYILVGDYRLGQISFQHLCQLNSLAD